MNGDGKVLPPGFVSLVVQFVMAMVLAWCVVQIAQMRANRFTSADGLDVWKAMSDKADVDDVPPQWFQNEVIGLELRIQELERQH
jgi:hypothetical protein